MKKLVTIFILILIAEYSFSIDFAENKLINIEGVVSLIDFYGPPNYGESPQTDQIERYYVLSFDRDTELFDNTSLNKYTSKEIQIIYNKTNQNNCFKNIDFNQFIGKDISITGYLIEAESGHHHTPLVFIVEQDIRKLLYNENSNFWPINNNLEVEKIGEVNKYCIFLTKYIFGASNRMTHRLVVFDQLNNYIGHFYGIDSNQISINTSFLIFNDIERKYGNSINFGNGIPEKIYFNGEVVEFRK